MTPANRNTAVEIAAAADLVAGYGPVKEAGAAAFRARVAELLPLLDAAPAPAGEKVAETA